MSNKMKEGASIDSPGSLIVVAGPSGAGKSSLVQRALKKIDRLKFSISYTTRNPRSGEQNGVDYLFVSREEFLALRDRDEFLEHAEVHGHLYATSRTQVAEAAKGRYRISGTVTQSGVPAEFLTLAPVYLEFGDDRLQRLGMVPLKGAVTQKLSVEVELPQRPRRVIVNARNDVLSR